MKRTFFAGIAAVAVIAVLVGGGVPRTSGAGTVVVSPTNMQGWAFVQEVPNGTGALVAGPATPPLGTGSANMKVDATGRELLATLAYAGTPLSAITALQYSTYQNPASTANSILAATLQFDVDYDLTDANTAWQGRLVFEPYFSGTVVKGAWQTWSPLTGLWWASGAPGNTVCPQSHPCTWAQVLAHFPHAGLRAGVGVLQFKAGGPWPGFDGNVDAFTITASGTSSTYDFELVDPCAPNQHNFNGNANCMTK